MVLPKQRTAGLNPRFMNHEKFKENKIIWDLILQALALTDRRGSMACSDLVIQMAVRSKT